MLKCHVDVHSKFAMFPKEALAFRIELYISWSTAFPVHWPVSASPTIISFQHCLELLFVFDHTLVATNKCSEAQATWIRH